MTSLPLLYTAAAVAAALAVANWFLYRRRPRPNKERRLPRHLTMAALVLVGLFALILALPVSDEVEIQVLGVFGIVLSGAIALSSNHALANAVAGLVLRINRTFETGDHIRVGEYEGRVSERGLFDTEIQTAARELVSLPNDYLTENPVVVLSNKGVLVSASVPLDNEVHYSVVEDALIRAASDVELIEPFTLVLAISDEAIVYRVSGMIEDDRRLISTRSALHRAILDRLEEAGIELVGPKPIEVSRAKTEPAARKRRVRQAAGPDVVDEVVFDKADRAAARDRLVEEIAKLREEKKSPDIDSRTVEARLEQKLRELERLDEEHPGSEPE